MKKRKFEDGGEIPPGGRFDSDTYARARKWVAEQQGKGDSEEVPAKSPAKAPARPVAPSVKAEAPAPRPAPAPEPKAASGRAEIPVGNEKAPPKDDSYQPGEFGRNVLNTMGAIGPGIGRAASAASRAAPAVSTGAVPVMEGMGAAVKYGPRAGMDVAKSTARGAQGRAEIRALRDVRNAEADAAAVRGAAGRAEVQAKRAIRNASTAPAEKAQRESVNQISKNAKNRMVANKARREDTEGVEFNCGGSVRRKGYANGGSVRGCGIAQKGHGKGTMR